MLLHENFAHNKNRQFTGRCCRSWRGEIVASSKKVLTVAVRDGKLVAVQTQVQGRSQT
jgi:hypothetical protein